VTDNYMVSLVSSNELIPYKDPKGSSLMHCRWSSQFLLRKVLKIDSFTSIKEDSVNKMQRVRFPFRKKLRRKIRYETPPGHSTYSKSIPKDKERVLQGSLISKQYKKHEESNLDIMTTSQYTQNKVHNVGSLCKEVSGPLKNTCSESKVKKSKATYISDDFFTKKNVASNTKSEKRTPNEKNLYKSYLRGKYKNSMNKRVNKSYLVNLKKEIEYGSEVDLSKVWEHHNKKLDVSSLSYIFEPKPQASTLPKSHKSQEIRCEKTNNDKDIINELQSKYNSLYNHIHILEDTKKKQLKSVSTLRQILIEKQKNYTDCNTNKHSKDQLLSKDTQQVSITNTNSVEGIGINMHKGSEKFPLFLEKRFERQKEISDKQWFCIKELMCKRWGEKFKLKVRKDVAEYYIVAYGKYCPLSNCCNSLTVTKITFDEGCKTYCMNKYCITKVLDSFMLPVDAREILYPKEKNKELPNTKNPIQKTEKSAIRVAKMTLNVSKPRAITPYKDTPLLTESIVLMNTKNKCQLELIIDKRQRMPLRKVKYLGFVIK